MNRSAVQKNLFNALIESYNSDKDLFSSYGDVVTLKRGRDDQDKDEEPSAGSNRGTKRRRSGKEESSKEATQKESKSTSSSKGNDDVSPAKEVTDVDARLWNLPCSQIPDREWNKTKTLKINNLTQDVLTGLTYDLMKGTSKSVVELQYHLEENARGRQVIPFDHFINNDLEYLKGGSLSQRYTTSITKTKAVEYGHEKWIEDKLSTTSMPTGEHITEIMEFFGYKHLEEIIVRRQDDQLYKFREGDFKRLRRQDIEDMLLLLVQGKLTNLNLDERFALNVALRMYTRRIVIQERVEDLQLAVKSYQKKINLSKSDLYRSDLRKKTPYTAYPDIQGIIYQDDMDRNCLMRTDELHKFSDGTLNYVRTALNDIATGIQMEYLPKRKWTKQDKQRARVMINVIDKKLKDRRFYTLAGNPVKEILLKLNLPDHRLPVPVISVGNLTWGGNGKTPMVEFIASWFEKDVGVSPLILTRGYGGADEARMLQRHFIGTSVKIGVGANRAVTAASFLHKHGFIYPLDIACFEKPIPKGVASGKIGVAILDDGMQHISMWHDLDIVMVNALSPWGNHHLIPLGPLREPLTAFSRAHAAVIHHADMVPDQSLSVIESTILEKNRFLPVYRSAMTPSHFFKAPNVSNPVALGVLSEKIVLCLSAIGSPDSFVQRIEKMGPVHVDRLDYSDHHQFRHEDIKMIRAKLEDLNNNFGSKPTVVVTEKDYDRDSEILGGLYPFDVLVLCCKMQIISHNGCSEDSFKNMLVQSLSRNFCACYGVTRITTLDHAKLDV
ncbi:probable tetraacyldisaccharide 4'-kinase, mitochondrial isoform X1 [Tanacetum coccineum]